MKIKKVVTAVVIAASLLAPVSASASEPTKPLWDNPTEYFSMPIGTHDANKSEKLLKGHTYRVDFEAETYGENTLLIYTQNRKYLNKSIKLADYMVPYTFLFTPATDTHLVFEDAQGMGDINIWRVSVEEIKDPDALRSTKVGQYLYLENPY